MRNLKIFSVALLCAQNIYGNICTPKQGSQPTIQIIGGQGSVENCANPNKPYILPNNGQGNNSGAECIIGGGSSPNSQNGHNVPMCGNGGQQFLPRSYPQGGNGFVPSAPVYPGPNGQYVPVGPMGPMPGNHATGFIPVPVQPMPVQPVPVVPVQPAPQPPANITQIIPPPQPSATTIIQPSNPSYPPAPSNPPAPQPPKQETQCKVKNVLECVPVTPEEEVPEAPEPQNNNPVGPTSVIVYPSNPSGPNGPQACVPPTVNPNPMPNPSNNQNGGSPNVCVPSAPSNFLPGQPQNVMPSQPQNFLPGTPQSPANTVIVPMNNVQPSGGSPSNDCSSPSNMINSLCDNSNIPGQAMKGQVTSCDIPNSTECLAKFINSQPQPTPMDAMECTPSPRTLVDVGVLAPASESYIQSHQNSCL